MFTASQITRACGIRRESAAEKLCHIPSAGAAAVRGKNAEAWAFADLPMDWKMEITRRGVKRGFKDGEDFLTHLPAPWKCPLPWLEISEKHRTKAEKLQRALRRALASRFEGTKGEELARIGMEDYRAEFGYPLKDSRHLRRLLDRTCERDAGDHNWERLEIYLDERAFMKSKPVAAVARMTYQHRALDEMIQTLENRQSPTADDRKNLWDRVFRHYEELTAELPGTADGNRQRRASKQSLQQYILEAFPMGTLCASAGSLKRRFDEKLGQWLAPGPHCRTPEALEDRRAVASGNFRTPDFAEDLRKIRNRAVKLNGNKALARNMLEDEGQLSAEFCDYYRTDRRTDKSRVPKKIRDAITPAVDSALPLWQGPWEAKMRGPYIPRNWDEVKPGDWFSADDVTWNHYFKERLPDGRWQILRGECLVMTDLKTGYPIDFLLIPGKYNGEHVRALTLRAHDRVGLPRLGFYFEQGVWRSRLVTGDNRRGMHLHWRDTENGLSSEGLELTVRNATTPRAKPIEGLFRILQERMRSITGFVGFNERTETQERVQAMILRAHRGDAEALKFFPTKLEWRDKIAEVIEAFANDPQNGKMLRGQSPAEAWAAEIRDHPLKMLATNARHILSTHRRKVIVKQAGIELTIRGKKYLYYNEHTGPLIGHEVFAHFNIEMPELLTVRSVNNQNFFSVRSVELPAMTATRAQLEEVNKLRKAHMASAKGVFGDIRHEVISTLTRDNDHSKEEKEFGEFHNAEAAQFAYDRTEERNATGKARRKAFDIGIDPDRLPVKRPKQVAEAVGRYEDRIAKLREEESAKEQEHAKTYALNPDKKFTSKSAS